MKILYLTNELNYSDGVASHLFYLIKHLQLNGNASIYLMCGGGSGIEKFRALGIEILIDKNINHKNRTIKNFTSAIHSVYKFVKDKKIDIVHSHNHYASNIASKAAKFVNFETVQTVHGLIPETGRLKHYCSSNFIAVNDHVFDHLLKKNIPKNKITLIYNGIDFGAEAQHKSKNQIKIISASRLEIGKGIDTFIKAVSMLPPEYKVKAEFIISGSGSLESKLKDLNENLKTRIKFTGNLKNLKNQFEQTHVFVITSESEGLPITMLEAAASKNLVISSDFIGIENIITNDKEGLIFRMHDAKDLSSKIKFALDNIQMTNEIAEAFFLKAKSKFNAIDMAEKHYCLYKNILC